MMLEVLSQGYRSVLPIVPWLSFLLHTDENRGGWIFSGLLCISFFLFKVTQLFSKLLEVRKAVLTLRLDVVGLPQARSSYWVFLYILATSCLSFQSYGSVPSRDELQKVDNLCAICQDKLTDPVKLSCMVRCKTLFTFM